MTQRDHRRTKLILKIVGLCLAIGGLCCTIVGFADMFASTRAGDMPELFFLLIIGFPSLAFGLMMTALGFRRELTTYAKNETVPVVNEAGEELAPAVRSVSQAAADGIRQAGTKTCPKCGAACAEGLNFCEKCGTPLTKTCPVCGKTVNGDAAFCGHCGAKLTP